MTHLWKLCLAGAASAVLSLTATVNADTRIQGAGATFPAPLYAKWTQTYNNAHPDVKVDYSAIGSGGGIKSITDRVVQFAGSDAPMTKDQESKAPATLLHLPTVAGPVVLTYNLPGLSSDIKIDGDTLANIYLNKITKWNDPKLVALNAGVALPDAPIVVVHRSDGSGTTFVFTNYLSKVSADWKENVGNATSVQWPTGLGGKGNDGVAAAVKNTQGGIGYIELAYALKNKLPFATQINKDGKEVRASIAGVESAIAHSVTDFPADLKVSITDASGPDSYPICGFTYFLVYDDLSYLQDKGLAQNTVDFINWCETDGQNAANELGYAKLPKDAQDKVLAKIKAIKFDGEPLAK
jgi:phosphate transport system substrate-binding protein